MMMIIFLVNALYQNTKLSQRTIFFRGFHMTMYTWTFT